MKKFTIFMVLLLVLTGCTPADNGQGEELETQQKTFYETFDTQITYSEFTNDQEAFDERADFVEKEFTRLHKLYDNYRTYEGVHNVMTINNKAGIEPVEVDPDLFNLIKYSKDSYDKTLGYTNIAMGSVLEIWHDVREHNEGLDESETILPNQADLEAANQYTDINSIVLDEENMTVYIDNENTSIDLGAVAKGYATELVAQKLIDMGVEHGSINAGGNVKTLGERGNGRTTWGIALQNFDPDSSDYLEVLYLEGEESVVTSGDYQRFFMHDGQRYHHLINPFTLWPETTYRSVSIVTKDSGLADLLSTAIYLADEKESQEIIDNFEDEIGVIWATDEGKTNTPNMDNVMQSRGAESR